MGKGYAGTMGRGEWCVCVCVRAEGVCGCVSGLQLHLLSCCVGSKRWTDVPAVLASVVCERAGQAAPRRPTDTHAHPHPHAHTNTILRVISWLPGDTAERSVLRRSHRLLPPAVMTTGEVCVCVCIGQVCEA